MSWIMGKGPRQLVVLTPGVLPGCGAHNSISICCWRLVHVFIVYRWIEDGLLKQGSKEPCVTELPWASLKFHIVQAYAASCEPSLTITWRCRP